MTSSATASGRSRGELAAAMRSRELWEKLGADIPGIGFRPAGSFTLMRTPGEVSDNRHTHGA
jgi:hypothetical protein